MSLERRPTEFPGRHRLDRKAVEEPVVVAFCGEEPDVEQPQGSGLVWPGWDVVLVVGAAVVVVEEPMVVESVGRDGLVVVALALVGVASWVLAAGELVVWGPVWEL